MAEGVLTGRDTLRVLFVEDNADDYLLNLRELRRVGLQVEHATADNRADTVALLQESAWDVVLSDHAMPGFSGQEVVRLVEEIRPGTPCIIVSGAIGETAAVELVQLGAYDFVNKDRIAGLAPAVSRALRMAASRRATRQAEEALRQSEQQLRELNETLEQRVQERTREVMAQNRLIETALNTLKDVFFVISPEGRIVRCNNELASVTGVTREKLQGMRLDSLLHDEDSASCAEWLETTQETGSASQELRLKLAGGGSVPYEFMGASLRDEQGQADGVCGIAQNVAARRQTEYRLKEAIRAVINDATWFAQSVLDKMSDVDVRTTDADDVDLTEREIDVLELLAAGMKNDQIATDLGISYATVRNYVARIYEKLGVHSRAEAVIWARERGFGQGDAPVLT